MRKNFLRLLLQQPDKSRLPCSNRQLARPKRRLLKGCPFYRVSEHGSFPHRNQASVDTSLDSYFARGRNKRDILHLLIYTASRLKRRRAVQTVSHRQNFIKLYCLLQFSDFVVLCFCVVVVVPDSLYCLLLLLLYHIGTSSIKINIKSENLKTLSRSFFVCVHDCTVDRVKSPR